MKGLRSRVKHSRVGPLAGGHGKRCRFGIYSERDFLQLLGYERKRAERARSSFSLVVFDVSSPLQRKGKAQMFVGGLQKCVRSVDHLGWFGSTAIGLLLPDTDHQGAERLVASIAERIPAIAVPYTIYFYTC